MTSTLEEFLSSREAQLMEINDSLDFLEIDELIDLFDSGGAFDLLDLADACESEDVEDLRCNLFDPHDFLELD